MVLAIVGWMGSGFVLPSEEEEQAVRQTGPEPVAVTIETISAEPVTLFFQAEGQALPDRNTAIRVEGSGDVAEVLVSRCTYVEDGAVIARRSARQAEADLARARGELARAQREFDNAAELLDRGVGTATRLSEARAALAAADAAVATAEEGIEALDITAPFATTTQ